ncbi:ImmA/IrrE family metallo-endopeptidase [Domibacillus indicus]|nr:ImmA/IrrE family metallo-endopeptidase [Domibacillus indicus]
MLQEEKWQEFAQEVCHLLRHSGNQTVPPFPFVQLQEWQAGTFTLHLCMPTFMLEKLMLNTLLRKSVLLSGRFKLGDSNDGRYVRKIPFSFMS